MRTYLHYYRDKDKVEKIFDTVKNEMDGDRLHSHSQYSMDGRLFIKFIALIIYMQITKVMRDTKLVEIKMEVIDGLLAGTLTGAVKEQIETEAELTADDSISYKKLSKVVKSREAQVAEPAKLPKILPGHILPLETSNDCFWYAPPTFKILAL